MSQLEIPLAMFQDVVYENLCDWEGNNEKLFQDIRQSVAVNRHYKELKAVCNIIQRNASFEPASI